MPDKKDESSKADSKNQRNKEGKDEEEEAKVWPERTDPQCRLPRVVIKWLVSLKLRNKFLHPRWDAASGVLIAEILSRYYPETGPGFVLPACYGHGWRHFERNWFVLKQFFKTAELEFPGELITPLMTRKGNAGYFALIWLWETFEQKTKLPTIEKGALLPTNEGAKGKEAPPTCVNDAVIKNLDFFHHDRPYQLTLPIGQRETHTTCIRQNISGNQMKWDDCQQSWASWSNRLWEEQKDGIKALQEKHPTRMGRKKTGILWKAIRRPVPEVADVPTGLSRAASHGTLVSEGKRSKGTNLISHTSIARHANMHAGYK